MGHLVVHEALRARVTGGRLLLDVPTALPQGTELNLVLADEEDDLDETERALLNDALDRWLAHARTGNTIPMDEVVARLRQRTGRAT